MLQTAYNISVLARISKGHGARLKKALTWSFKGTYDVTTKLSYKKVRTVTFDSTS